VKLQFQGQISQKELLAIARGEEPLDFLGEGGGEKENQKKENSFYGGEKAASSRTYNAIPKRGRVLSAQRKKRWGEGCAARMNGGLRK